MPNLTRWVSPNGTPFTIDQGAVNTVEPFFNRLNQVYPQYGSHGGYAHRPMRTLDGRNLGGLSTHATGYTLDVKAPDAVLRQMHKEFPHLTWGGKFSHYDPVHFEFLPTAQKYGDLPPLSTKPFVGQAGAEAGKPSGPSPAASPSPTPTPGPQPMADPSTPNVMAYAGMLPNDTQRHRKIAQMLMQQATDASPVQHWTQALARVVAGGVGRMHDNAAQQGEREGQSSVAAMMGGNPTPQQLFANPYTQEMGKQLWLAQAKARIKGPESDPSNVREWQYFSKLPPEEQEHYLRMKRAEKWQDTGTQFVLPNAANPRGPVVQSIPKNVAEKEAQEAIGQARGKAEADLPRIMDNASQALDIIEKIKKHPGKGWGVGFPGGAVRVPFTEQAGFVDLVEQTGGKVFLEAFNSLKGGGQITEAEGRKATEALARLRRDVKPEVFDAAIEDIRAVIEAGALRAQRAAGKQQTMPTPSPGMAPNPSGSPVRVQSPDEARRLPSGTPIMLPDGTVGRVP